jgi:glycosyltransferase involved in cell wall biosynthesis
MRLLFVVQRYGPGSPGGAEQACRGFATRLAQRGHDVSVLTSRAVSHLGWADHEPAGTSVVEGVTVHRLSVRRVRDEGRLADLTRRAVHGPKPVSLRLQEAWLEEQGPDLCGLERWLSSHAAGFDVAAFFTYLYLPAYRGLPVAARETATVLHPTAHSEAPLGLPLFDLAFRQPDAFAFLSPEEEALVRRRFRVSRPSATVGVGVEAAGGEGPVFRRRFGLGDRPYLLAALGRVDPLKGSSELLSYFAAYKRRRPGDLSLVVLGEVPGGVAARRPDVVLAGYVDEELRRSALAGCLAAVVPSYFESFSLALVEAFAAGRPALVQGSCEVLVGQARRSRAGLAYRGFAEFEAGVDLLLGRPELAAAMGQAGRAYVDANYRWDRVLDRYERLVSLVAGRRQPHRPRVGGPPAWGAALAGPHPTEPDRPGATAGAGAGGGPGNRAGLASRARDERRPR